MFEIFTQKLDFPPEAAQFLEECFLKIENHPEAFPQLCETRDVFCSQVMGGGYESILQQISFKTGIHLDSVKMVLMLFCLPTLKERYEKAGYSEAFFYDNAKDLTNKLLECKSVTGVWGTWALSWLENLFHMKRFKLGRLQYQKGICRLKEPYKDIVKAGDQIIECHIPMGEPLDIQQVRASLNWAYEFYKEDFPDGKVIATCETWLLYTPLISKLPESSNINKFSRLFDVVELEGDESNKNFWRIFNVRWPQDINTFTGRNTLQRIAIEHIKNRGTLGTGYGVIVLKERGTK